MTVEQLVRAGEIPHGDVGVTTVGEIRELGGDVVRTTGRGYHVTVVVGEGGISPEDLSSLFRSDLRENLWWPP